MSIKRRLKERNMLTDRETDKKQIEKMQNHRKYSTFKIVIRHNTHKKIYFPSNTQKCDKRMLYKVFRQWLCFYVGAEK